MEQCVYQDRQNQKMKMSKALWLIQTAVRKASVRGVGGAQHCVDTLASSTVLPAVVPEMIQAFEYPIIDIGLHRISTNMSLGDDMSNASSIIEEDVFANTNNMMVDADSWRDVLV